jgi:hypothetical protein
MRKFILILTLIFIYSSFKSQTWARAKLAHSTSGFNGGYGCCLDPTGNIYVTGEFYGSIVFGSYTLTAVSMSPGIYLVKDDQDNKQISTGKIII